MPRQNKPRWHEHAKRWTSRIDGTQVYFPREIGPKDEDKAWEYLAAYRRQLAARAVDPADPTVFALRQLYLAWAEGEVEAGRMVRDNYRIHTTHLDKFGLFAPAGSSRAYDDRRARSLSVVDLEAFVDAVRGRHSPHYVANLCRSIQAMYNWAARPVAGRTPARLLPENPLKGYRPPTIPRSGERFAERSEAAAFLRFFRGYADRRGRDSRTARFDRSTILLERVLIRTGCRPGEACTLRWTDIRWAAGRTGAGHAYAKAVIPHDRWKAGRATGKPRTIYLSPTLTRALRREHDRPGRHPTHVFVHKPGRNARELESTESGVPWSDSTALAAKIRKVRREAIAAGVAIADVGANALRNYRWRHTAISTLLMMGVDVPTVAELTGTSPEMIYRTYGHLLDGHLADAAERLHGKAKGRP